MNHSLRGLRILDLTRLLPGPFASKILADLGAEVIKVDDLSRPDLLTQLPPAALGGESVLSVYLHKNKARFGADLKNPASIELIKKLVKRCDVLLESLRPGVMSRMGLGFQQVRRLNRKILYISITGYGQRGDLSQKAGHDINFLAESGFMKSFFADRDWYIPSIQIADLVGGGYFAVIQILAALQARTRQARHIDVSMTQGMSQLTDLSRLTADQGSTGVITGLFARYHTYQTQDGAQVALGSLEEKFWRAFCEKVGRPEWIEMGQMPERQPELINQVAHLFASQPRSYWDRIARNSDFCLTIDPEADFFKNHDHLHKVTVSYQKEKVSFFETKSFNTRKVQKFNPAGANTLPILRQLGYTQAQIIKLKNSGVIQ